MHSIYETSVDMVAGFEAQQCTDPPPWLSRRRPAVGQMKGSEVGFVLASAAIAIAGVATVTGGASG